MENISDKKASEQIFALVIGIVVIILVFIIIALMFTDLLGGAGEASKNVILSKIQE